MGYQEYHAFPFDLKYLLPEREVDAVIPTPTEPIDLIHEVVPTKSGLEGAEDMTRDTGEEVRVEESYLAAEVERSAQEDAAGGEEQVSSAPLVTSLPDREAIEVLDDTDIDINLICLQTSG